MQYVFDIHFVSNERYGFSLVSRIGNILPVVQRTTSYIVWRTSYIRCFTYSVDHHNTYNLRYTVYAYHIHLVVRRTLYVGHTTYIIIFSWFINDSINKLYNTTYTYVTQTVYIHYTYNLNSDAIQSTMYNVHCTVYNVQSTMYNVHCTVYDVQYTMYNVHCTLYSVQLTIYNVHCTLYSVRCTIYDI